MKQHSPPSGVPGGPAEVAAMRDWLVEAAACLVHPGCEPSPPPCAELEPAYRAICGARAHTEQARRDLIEGIQMQSLQMVSSILAHDLHNLSLRLALLGQNLQRFYGDAGFLQSARHVLDDTVERMQSLVDSFRERQDTIVIKIPTDVNDVLRTTLRKVAAGNATRVAVVEQFGDPARVWADPFFLANAFRVLIENAFDAMPAGGTLTVRTGVARAAADGQRYTVVEIHDTGVGMTREFIERELFAPFRSGKGRGLGLGMYICQHIIHLHEGVLEVESEPRRGTCFRLAFPLGAEDSPAEATAL